MRYARKATMLAPVLFLLAAACSSGGTNADGTPRPRTSRNVITEAELENISVTNAYDAIQRLRSSWFQTRGVMDTDPGSSPIRLYIDGVSASSLEQLRMMPIGRVHEMRRISASDATTRWGTGHTQGAIEVITKG